MIQGKRILGVMIARGGSKGLPRKNLKLAGGKPLIAWTIEVAKKSKYLDRFVLSSEDLEIIEVAKKWGCEVPFVRPMELADDNVPGVDTVVHAVKTLPGFDYVVMLQPTSPLRTVDDLDDCIKYCVEREANVCASVTDPEKPPHWVFKMDGNNILHPIIDGANSLPQYRQILPKAYLLNGAMFMARTDWLLKHKKFLTDETLGYMMPRSRSIDVDTDMDWMMLEVLLQKDKNL
ncbi:MAG: acylneuraminate cytidylyltransferase family protein [Oligoflexia bacterium]|nr:acylneuraminate cytidylyltransferase family protein [Oligoflexia bacterium]